MFASRKVPIFSNLPEASSRNHVKYNELRLLESAISPVSLIVLPKESARPPESVAPGRLITTTGGVLSIL